MCPQSRLKKYPDPVAENIGKTVKNGATVTLIGDNPIRVDVNDATRTIHNVTVGKHILHSPAVRSSPGNPCSQRRPAVRRHGARL